ncbi:MAG: hypothetical protein MUF81_16395, partial [Verrucomicrobia bacterium]|nr:hypothetical protein [Verrucomicrobiota bacterium]
MIQGGNPLFDQIWGEEVVAAFVTSQAFAGFASRYFQMLRPFLSETAPKAFFDVGASRVKASYLLPGQFSSAKILGQYFRVVPKIVEQLAGEPVDAVTIKSVNRFCSSIILRLAGIHWSGCRKVGGLFLVTRHSSHHTGQSRNMPTRSLTPGLFAVRT